VNTGEPVQFSFPKKGEMLQGTLPQETNKIIRYGTWLQAGWLRTERGRRMGVG